LKLLAKERRFDGGRGSEFYKFNYRTETYGYRPFSISDYHMSKDIQPFDEKKVEEKELPKSTTFC
jgi:hypothetical protein